MSRVFSPRLPTAIWPAAPGRFHIVLARLVEWASAWGAVLAMAFVFGIALGFRLVHAGQPLLENFIDRQVHTAMIARHIAAGGALAYPEIDVGPFPAYYMLEFPAFPALAALLSGVAGLPLDFAGRFLSALACAVACLALFDLVRRHDGLRVGLLAALALAVMPVTIRYGRGFQPDAMMLAALLGGVWAMDRWSTRTTSSWLCLAACCIALALLLKVISAYILLPLGYLAWQRYGSRAWTKPHLYLALAMALVPAAAWYWHAFSVASGMETVSTPFWQWHKWLSPAALVSSTTYRQLAYYVGWRVLTPVGVLLAAVGMLVRPAGPRPMLFHAWLLSLAAYFPILVRKLDHEHYYLAIAPVAAVFIARALDWLATLPSSARVYLSGRAAAGCLGILLLGWNLAACRSTFRVPSEWVSVEEAARGAAKWTPPGALVAGHSSVLFYAERKGFMFAYQPHEVRYLMGTFGASSDRADPATLLEFYRSKGADYFVELLGTNREQANRRFFAQVRKQYPVVHEEPGKYLIVALRR